MRVVQPPPGPMPTLMPSAPRSSRNVAPSRGGDVAGNHLDVAEPLAELRDRALHHDRVAVGDVDDDDVDVRAHELRRALEVVAGGADGGADAQPPLAVARRERHAPLPHEVPRRDEAEQPAVGGHERQLLDLALDHQPLGRRRRRADLRGRRAGSLGVMRSDTRAPRRATNRMSRSVSRPASRRCLVDDHERADARSRHQRRRFVQRRGRPRCCTDRG